MVQSTVADARPSPFDQPCRSSPAAATAASSPQQRSGPPAAAAARAGGGRVWLWLATPWLLGGLLGAVLPPSLDPELSPALSRLSSVIGWVFFASWGISVYPQLYHNWLRKSAAGLSMDFLCLNLAGFICFAAYNCSLMWSPDVRAEYAARYGGSPAVHINDAMLPLHASGITAITIAQCLAYGRRQRARCAAAGLPSPTRLSGVAVAVLAALAGTIAAYAAAVWALQGRAAPGGWLSLLSFIYLLGYIKLAITLVKYVPQLMLNHKVKSTRGFAIQTVLLDLQGGLLALAQQALDAFALRDWAALTGNPVKFALSFTVLGFHSVFLTQHYVLYRGREPLLLADQQPSLLTGRLSTLLTGRLPTMALPDAEVQLTYGALPPVEEDSAEWEESDEEDWVPPLLTAPTA